MLSVAEYRKMLNDYVSSEENIKQRINYIEAFCRRIIKNEIQGYAKEIPEQK